MFVLVRLVILVVCGGVWNLARKSAWVMKSIPWWGLVAFLTAIAMLISLILDIIHKFKSL